MKIGDCDINEAIMCDSLAPVGRALVLISALWDEMIGSPLDW